MSRILSNTSSCFLCILLTSGVFSLLALRMMSSNTKLPSQIAPIIRAPSNSCQSIVISGINAVEQRCYPLLVNFADRCCQKAQKKNCLTGMQYGIKQCALYNKNSLNNNPTFVYRNRNLLNRKRGAGYWLWKPYIIFQELYYAREGDIIVYSDALVNFVANISHLTRLTDQQDIILFELTGFQVRLCRGPMRLQALFYSRKKDGQNETRLFL